MTGALEEKLREAEKIKTLESKEYFSSDELKSLGGQILRSSGSYLFKFGAHASMYFEETKRGYKLSKS